MWQILRRNPGAFAAALLLHLILAVLMLVGVDWLVTAEDIHVKPRVVQATIVSSEAVDAQVRQLRKAEEKRQAERERAEQELQQLKVQERQEQERLQALEKERQRQAHKQQGKAEVEIGPSALRSPDLGIVANTWPAVQRLRPSTSGRGP